MGTLVLAFVYLYRARHCKVPALPLSGTPLSAACWRLHRLSFRRELTPMDYGESYPKTPTNVTASTQYRWLTLGSIAELDRRPPKKLEPASGAHLLICKYGARNADPEGKETEKKGHTEYIHHRKPKRHPSALCRDLQI
jgi:hypothetical protein